MWAKNIRSKGAQKEISARLNGGYTKDELNLVTAWAKEGKDDYAKNTIRGEDGSTPYTGPETLFKDKLMDRRVELAKQWDRTSNQPKRRNGHRQTICPNVVARHYELDGTPSGEVEDSVVLVGAASDALVMRLRGDGYADVGEARKALENGANGVPLR